MSLNTIHLSVIQNLGTGIIPTTRTPGAADLQVAGMIQVVYSSWPDYRQASFRAALERVELLVIEQYGLTSDQISQDMTGTARTVSSLLDTISHDGCSDVLRSSCWCGFDWYARPIY